MRPPMCSGYRPCRLRSLVRTLHVFKPVRNGVVIRITLIISVCSLFRVFVFSHLALAFWNRHPQCVSFVSLSPLCTWALHDIQILQSASLELINETVHPQVLPAAGPHFLYGRRTGNVLDLGTDARLDNLCLSAPRNREHPGGRASWRASMREASSVIGEGYPRSWLSGMPRHLLRADNSYRAALIPKV